MKKGFKLTAVMAGLLLLTAGSSGLFAVCQEDTVFPMFQCGFVGWFAPPPADAGNINAIWWQIGYGNNLLNNGIIGAAGVDGTGAVGTTFPGNDSGIASPTTTTTGPFGLKSAQAVLGGLYPGQIPAGALCADYENSWGGFGVDGCADNRRTTSGYDNDNVLNPYWGTLGPCPYQPGEGDCSPYFSTYYQVDYPIAILARTSSNKYFALAFVASNSRNQEPRDGSEGVFNVGAIVNGDPSPIPGKGNNIIPWQAVPKPHVTNVTPTSPGVPRNVSLQWDNVRIIHDGSSRPTGARATAPVAAGGVGVLDHLDEAGGLCRFQLQTAAVPGGNPSPDPSTLTWVNVPGAPACGGTGPVTANLTVNPDTAIRVRTVLGKLARTASTAVANARLGASGDLGFEATDCTANNCLNSAPITVIGGGLVGQTIIDGVAVKEQGGVRVTFRTTAEASVSGIDVLGKGDVVIRSVACKQCTTGVGDSYDVLLENKDLKGAKSLKLRLNGPGSLTDAIPIQ